MSRLDRYSPFEIMASSNRPRPGKKERLARWIHATGLPSLLGRVPQRNSLLVINYHRVGDAEATPYDPAVFSATAEEFQAQMEFIARHLEPVTLPEALALMEAPGNGAEHRCRALVTFDDGYLDNYEIAVPILRRVGLAAVFFVPTSFIGSHALPWWDEIAYLVKSARQRRFALSYPEPEQFDIEASGLREVLRRVLNLYKVPGMLDSDRFIAELEAACEGKRPTASGAERCFVNWDEVRSMAGAGMAIGAHTHTHRLLGRLPADEQLAELAGCRRILRDQGGVEADTIAYPVGLRTSFTAETKSIAQQAGYRAGFSFYGGVNRPGQIDRFDVRRVGVDAQSLERFGVQTASAALFGSWWP